MKRPAPGHGPARDATNRLIALSRVEDLTILDIKSFTAGQWVGSDSGARDIRSAITGEVIARAGCDALDVGAMLEYARDIGGPNLRAMTFHDRAKMLKALALNLGQHK